MASGVAKANADIIQISGHDGGTGASPISSIKHCGGPIEMGLAEVRAAVQGCGEGEMAGRGTGRSRGWGLWSQACRFAVVQQVNKPKPLVLGCPPPHAPGLIGPCPPSPPLPLPRPQVHQTLTTNGLRERVALRADGGMRTGRDVLVTAALGADEYGFGTVVRGLCFLIGRYVLAPLEAGFGWLVWSCASMLPFCPRGITLQLLTPPPRRLADPPDRPSPFLPFPAGHDCYRLHHGARVSHQQLPRGRGQPARGAARPLPGWVQQSNSLRRVVVKHLTSSASADL